MRAAALGLTLSLALVPQSARAQTDLNRQIRQNQARLDSIRGERDGLESELAGLRGRLRDISSELVNLDRQKSATTRIVNELDRQMSQLTSQLDTVTLDLLLTGDALVEKRAIQQRRIVEIYKRGPSRAFEVMLAAESFSDLLSRYKYLVLVSRQDRALVAEVEDLRNRIAQEREQMAVIERELTRTRDERGRELTRFQRLERQRQRSLRETRTTAARATERIAELEAAEAQLNDIIATLERRRRGAIAEGRAVAAGSITDATRGSLPWPIDGPVIYRYGRASGPDNTTIRYDGVGVRATVGSQVRAVAAGQVFFAGAFGTYGPTVMIEHGGGYYTLYLYLSRITVTGNQVVQAGTVVGESGGQATEEGPHFEFQIRENIGGGQTIALDPLNWLVRRRR